MLGSYATRSIGFANHRSVALSWVCKRKRASHAARVRGRGALRLRSKWPSRRRGGLWPHMCECHLRRAALARSTAGCMFLCIGWRHLRTHPCATFSAATISHVSGTRSLALPSLGTNQCARGCTAYALRQRVAAPSLRGLGNAPAGVSRLFARVGRPLVRKTSRNKTT